MFSIQLKFFEIKVLVEGCKGGEVGQPQIENDERTRGHAWSEK